MSIIIDKRRAHGLARMWSNCSTGSIVKRITRGAARRVVVLFLNWLDRYGIFLMTDYDNIGQTDYYEDLLDEIGKIRKWKKEKP